MWNESSFIENNRKMNNIRADVNENGTYIVTFIEKKVLLTMCQAFGNVLKISII